MSTEINLEELYDDSVKILTDLIGFRTISGEDNSALINYCENYLHKIGATSFKTFDEVIERANNHELGLSSYICTNSMDKAYKASELMQTGTVAVNTPLVAIAEAPFGGIKQSGYGREGGSMAIKDYLNIKYTHFGFSYE